MTKLRTPSIGVHGARILLTGGIGSGKSTVAAMLERRGAVVVDADQVAREVVGPGSAALAEIRAAFGSEVFHANGSLDRAALASIVFRDPSRLEALNTIMHPRILQRSAQLLEAVPSNRIAVYDAPLVLEMADRAVGGWDRIIVVDADDDVRIDRLVGRGMSVSDARARMAMQVSRAERNAIADVVIDNSRDLAFLESSVDELWGRLQQESSYET